jgi:putative nucleotidyltransferase with HDIG domain
VELSEAKKITEKKVPASIREKVSSYPSMSQTVVKLRNVLKKEDVAINEIENILRHDPGLSTNILRLANSAHFGLSLKVGSLKKAIMILGLKRFEQIAISAYMNKTMDKVVEGYNMPSGALWLHSIAVATTAEALAKFLKIVDIDDVFIPALLHDLGKLVLGEFVKKESKLIESIVAKGESLVRAEYMVLGTDHAEIGALILRKWLFPVGIVNAVRWHHDPEYLSETDNCLKDLRMQSDIVYISNLICNSEGGSCAGGGKLPKLPSAMLKRLGITLNQFEVFTEKAHVWMNKLSDTLSFQ